MSKMFIKFQKAITLLWKYIYYWKEWTIFTKEWTKTDLKVTIYSYIYTREGGRSTDGKSNIKWSRKKLPKNINLDSIVIWFKMQLQIAATKKYKMSLAWKSRLMIYTKTVKSKSSGPDARQVHGANYPFKIAYHFIKISTWQTFKNSISRCILWIPLDFNFWILKWNRSEQIIVFK